MCGEARKRVENVCEETKDFTLKVGIQQGLA